MCMRDSCLFATVFLMYTFLLSEMANLLVNPTEGLALAHQPIAGLTYVAAKLTHLAGFILIGVLSLNLFPAVAPLFVAKPANLNAGWLYPVNHLVAALTVMLF